MPENMIITKEEKKKPEKIKYIDYENYAMRSYNKIDNNLNKINAIANNQYLIVMDQKGNGYSKYKDILVNRFKPLSEENEGIVFYLKSIKNKRIWTSNYMNYLSKPDKYEITFSEDVSKIRRIDGGIETLTKVTTAQEEPVEIRNINIKNNGLEEEILEITSALEPLLSTEASANSHPAFNKLFLKFENVEENIITIKRRKITFPVSNSACLFLKILIWETLIIKDKLNYVSNRENYSSLNNNYELTNWVQLCQNNTIFLLNL